ncbi:MAG: tripartite tricarboxylate transporter substrate binding protein [Burkholderiales bacterium]|nr:tripartite tricarboxylate transporter substrate binding protein [Burkholderiales bacterium]
MKRRLALSVVGAAAGMLLLAAPALAADIAAPVSLVVPYPAGGGSDITARIVAGPIGKALGADVIVENIAGATGAIAIQKVLNSAADGRMLYQGSQNELIIPPLTIKSVRFKPNDLEIVHPITTTRLVLVVRKSFPAKNLQEFVELGKRQSATQPLSYGSAGIGSLYHLIPERMANLAGVKYTHVPYKGAAPMMQDLIGDRIDFTVMAFSTSMLASVKAGHYRIIANMSTDKPRELADLPSISEASVFKGVDYASNAAYYVRKGTPADIKQRLNRAIDEALSTKAVIDALEADGRIVLRNKSLADSEAFYRDEIAKYDRIVAETGFQPID